MMRIRLTSLALSWLLAACGGGGAARPGPLDHQLDDMHLAPVAVSAKGNVVASKQELDIAAMEKAKAQSDMAEIDKASHDELLGIMGKLEHHYRDMCDIEFTVERRKLWMLQTRVGKRTAGAAFRIATQLVDQGLIDLDEALDRGRAEIEKARRRIEEALAVSLGSARPISMCLSADFRHFITCNNNNVSRQFAHSVEHALEPLKWFRLSCGKAKSVLVALRQKHFAGADSGVPEAVGVAISVCPDMVIVF